MSIPRTLTFALFACAAMLSGCGKSEKSGESVTLRDMDVVDGTANDAMIDLDNAMVDGTALADQAPGGGTGVGNESADGASSRTTASGIGNTGESDGANAAE